MFLKSVVFLETNKKTAGLHHTEDRAGDAPKPQFSIKPIENQHKSNNQPPANHGNYLLFLTLTTSTDPVCANHYGLPGFTIEQPSHSQK